MNRLQVLSILLAIALSMGVALAALNVPSSIDQPGTQPEEVKNLESPDKCDNCHNGYDLSIEPAFNWRGA